MPISGASEVNLGRRVNFHQNGGSDLNAKGAKVLAKGVEGKLNGVIVFRSNMGVRISNMKAAARHNSLRHG
jgi:hypothetical protein